MARAPGSRQLQTGEPRATRRSLAAAYRARYSDDARQTLAPGSSSMPEPHTHGLTQARLALGRQLAAARKAAGHTQHTLAPLTLCGRSTIANVERGRQSVGRDFWIRC